MRKRKMWARRRFVSSGSATEAKNSEEANANEEGIEGANTDGAADGDESSEEVGDGGEEANANDEGSEGANTDGEADGDERGEEAKARGEEASACGGHILPEGVDTEGGHRPDFQEV